MYNPNSRIIFINAPFFNVEATKTTECYLLNNYQKQTERDFNFFPEWCKNRKSQGVLHFLASGWAGLLPTSILQELRYYNCQSFVCIKAFIWKAQSKSPFSYETVLIYVLFPSPDLINLCMALNLCILYTKRRMLFIRGACSCCPLFNICLTASLLESCIKCNRTGGTSLFSELPGFPKK